MPRIARVRLAAPAALLPELAAFYGGALGLPVVHGDVLGVTVGESLLELAPAGGEPFYHLALLVPGDRFDAARRWAEERVELLPDAGSGDAVFDFSFWDALACYFHDPAGSIVELIAHRGIAERGATGPFTGAELVGLSEVGIVCDPPAAEAAIARELGLRLWDGTADGPSRLAFVGEQARTLILARAGRPWLPTGRPAEAWPVEAVIDGLPAGRVELGPGVAVMRV